MKNKEELIENLKSWLHTSEISDKNMILRFKYNNLKTYFHYGLAEENKLFEKFVSIETRMQIDMSSYNLTENQIIEEYDKIHESSLGECYFYKKDMCEFVFKSTLYCEEIDYLEMLQELIQIHEKLHLQVQATIQRYIKPQKVKDSN